ncbi:hypothetical protein BV898_07113 [Hypsibius exemplaris]|uniref:Uncharacterized protein n=1 Tax=Hypsibius exemplaris TaxID=2072580 RepID=A0A1W0WUH1_HYPEX|nr:hypothetical protein BV898_07113 [Hypsibius exemplaris]
MNALKVVSILSTNFTFVTIVLPQFQHQHPDRFHEILIPFRSVDGANCASRPRHDLFMSMDVVSHISNIKNFYIYPLFANRTNLAHVHNMVLNRVFFYSFLFRDAEDADEPGLIQIVEALKIRKIFVSQKAVSNLIRKNINKEAGSDTAPSLVKPRGSPKLRTSGLVDAIEKDMSGPNPLTRSALSLKYGVSATTIARVVSQDSEGKVRKKCRVHVLSNKQAKQRLDRGSRFLRYINSRKWKNVITIDEAWV